MACDREIIGILRMALYINKDVRFNFPDPSIENEVDIIAHAQGSYVISDVEEYQKWERSVSYSANYKQNYSDIFSFTLHGIDNNVPGIIQSLRNNRLGYICEIITKENKSFVFPCPVFLDEKNTKPIDSNSWNVSLSYRVPTFQDKYNKLNTLLMTESFVLIGGMSVLGWGAGQIVLN